MTWCDLSYRKNNEMNDAYSFWSASGAIRPDVDAWFFMALNVFGSLHLLLSLWMLVEYFVDNYRNFVLPRLVYWMLP